MAGPTGARPPAGGRRHGRGGPGGGRATLMAERGRQDPRRGRAAAGAAAQGQTPDSQNGGQPEDLGRGRPRPDEGQHGGPARLEVPALRSATRGWRPGPTLPVPGGGTAENADRHQPHPTARLGPTWAKRKTGGMLGQQPERGHGHDGRGKAAQTRTIPANGASDFGADVRSAQTALGEGRTKTGGNTMAGDGCRAAYTTMHTGLQPAAAHPDGGVFGGVQPPYGEIFPLEKLSDALFFGSYHVSQHVHGFPNANSFAVAGAPHSTTSQTMECQGTGGTTGGTEPVGDQFGPPGTPMAIQTGKTKALELAALAALGLDDSDDEESAPATVQQNGPMLVPASTEQDANKDITNRTWSSNIIDRAASMTLGRPVVNVGGTIADNKALHHGKDEEIKDDIMQDGSLAREDMIRPESLALEINLHHSQKNPLDNCLNGLDVGNIPNLSLSITPTLTSNFQQLHRGEMYCSDNGGVPFYQSTSEESAPATVPQNGPLLVPASTEQDANKKRTLSSNIIHRAASMTLGRPVVNVGGTIADNKALHHGKDEEIKDDIMQDGSLAREDMIRPESLALEINLHHSQKNPLDNCLNGLDVGNIPNLSLSITSTHTSNFQ